MIQAAGRIPPQVEDGPNAPEFPSFRVVQVEGKRVRQRACGWCGAPTNASTPRRRFCQDDCRVYYWRWHRRRRRRA